MEMLLLIMSITGCALSTPIPACNHSLVFALTGFDSLVRYDLLSGQHDDSFTPGSTLPNAVAVASDQVNGYVFFSDVVARQIWKKDYFTPATSVAIANLPIGAVPDGIDVDPAAQRVYYVDFGLKQIVSMDYDGNDATVLISSAENLDNPRAIVVDPATSTMYYTDWGAQAHISSADLDGSNIVILQDTDMIWPNGLTADFTDGKLYWCDGNLDTISRMNTDGSGRETLFTRDPTEYSNLHFFDILHVGDDLYLTDWQFRAIFQFPKNGGGALTQITTFAYRPDGIAEICTPPASTSATTSTTTTATTTADTTQTTTSTDTTAATTSGTYDCGANNPCKKNITKFYYAHHDPGKYVQCSQWQQCWVRDCPGGLVWSQQANTCDWP